MSPVIDSLLQQFIPEARDLLEQAGRSLLALEREPGGSTPMNELFRAVHTLKGTSGLFDILPLTRVVHAAEDLLDAVQSGQLVLVPGTADMLLDALDQIGLWIDSLASGGELPEAAEVTGTEWVARLRTLLPATTGTPNADTVADGAWLPDWVAALAPADQQQCAAGRRSDHADLPLFSISYAPDTACFFRGEDPLALMTQIQGLLLLRMEPVAPWPALQEIDPFVCNVRMLAIAAAPRAELEHQFRYVDDQVEITLLPATWSDAVAAPKAGPPPSALTDAIRTLLAAQRRLLETPTTPELAAGKLDATARALLGCLRQTGRLDLIPGLDAAAAQSRLDERPAPLIAFIAELIGDGLVDAATVASSVASVTAPREAPPAETRAAAPSTLRVEPGKIDTLMNLIGELIVAKNALAYLARQAETGTLDVRELAREIKDRQALVNRIAEEMQAAVMAVRMLPVDHVFQRFPRLVRDTARRLGKHVELVVEGGDTEADKNVIEALADPLIHIVRNSLDHGLETPEERRAAGKPEHGTIRLQAVQDNDNVIIRVVDDGRGIDPDLVRRKAVEKGLMDRAHADALPDDEAVMLVFAAGFSTVSAVSDLSGRGVGMDVVRTGVEKAGGRVTLASRKGQGTTVELTLPLSMAVTRIMTVVCGGRLFGVPMSLVVETVRVARDTLHRFRDREAFVLRDSVVPVVRLDRLLDVTAEPAGMVDEAILVVRLNGELLGVVVDAFREGMEVIVKPMDGMLAGLRGFAGTTLLGDGQVLLILDLRELVL